MKPKLSVFALPRYADPNEILGSTAIVIDVLRAATTIAYALEAGAHAVVPCLEVADALALADKFDPDEIVLGGEREGSAIEGFQLGNSPEEYTSDQVGGKTILFTTTNGTRAMLHARKADNVFIAAFVNAASVVEKLLDRENICILCAGTDGKFSEDDVLLAGMLVDRIQRQSGMAYQQNGQAITAQEFWLNAFALPHALGAEPLRPERLAEQLRKSLGARNLLDLGLDDDILAAAYLDRFDLAPQLDPKTMRIQVSIT
jgi:2-phosphosulfolactate phosphatase